MYVTVVVLPELYLKLQVLSYNSTLHGKRIKKVRAFPISTIPLSFPQKLLEPSKLQKRKKNLVF